MTVTIEKLGVVIPGQVTRKFDGTDTTITLTGDQCRHLYEQLGEIVRVFQRPPAVSGSAGGAGAAGYIHPGMSGGGGGNATVEFRGSGSQ